MTPIFGQGFGAPVAPSTVGAALDEEVSGSDISRIYQEGLARPERVPEGAPTLTGGSQAPQVRDLVAVLNRELGAGLADGDVVTTDVLVACRALRSQYAIPDEQGVPNPENHIGPNLWAAVACLG